MINLPFNKWNAEGCQNAIRIALEARFGSVPSDIVIQLQTVMGEERLGELAGAAVLCTNLEAFRAKLEAGDAVLNKSRDLEHDERDPCTIE
jgi:hypothetical protein